MTPRLIALFVMAFMMLGFWQWPRLFEWGGEAELHEALRFAFTLSIFLSCAVTAFISPSLPTYTLVLVAWFVLALLHLPNDTWLAYDAAGQAFLALLWIEAAVIAETRPQRLVSLLALAMHLVAWTVGLAAKVNDPGFTAAAPEVIDRALGWPGALAAYTLPAVVIVGAAMMVRRWR